MAHDGSVTRLIGDLRSDDSAVRDLAARLIWQRYFHALLELARSNLDKRVRRRTDEEDVAQSMFKSFCLRQQKGRVRPGRPRRAVETPGDDHAAKAATPPICTAPQARCRSRANVRRATASRARWN